MIKRTVIRTENMTEHRNPIPPAVTIGGLILPSVISGAHPQNGTSEDASEQVRQAFVNMKEIVEAGGGGTDTIGRITVYLKDLADREYVNREWVAMFPDADDRPARHVVLAPSMQGNLKVQLDVIALVKDAD